MTQATSIHANLHHTGSHARKAATPDSVAGGFAAVMTGRQTRAAASATPANASGAAGPPSASNCAAAYNRFIGRSTGSGQCVALVRAANPAIGSTAGWVRDQRVQGNASLQPGTAIATFTAAGRYANATDGSSHAAIYLGQTEHGVQVLDQWAGKPAAVRTIPWSHPGAHAANTGGAFYVVKAGQTSQA